MSDTAGGRETHTSSGHTYEQALVGKIDNSWWNRMASHSPPDLEEKFRKEREALEEYDRISPEEWNSLWIG